MKLYCFPYAGGSASMYGRWKAHLNKNIDIVPVELAGRGRRIDEALYSNFPEVIADVVRQMGVFTRESYCLFGHSFGAKIAFELARFVHSRNLPGPKHIFLSGRGAPHVPDEGSKIYEKLSDEAFKNEVIRLGGTPAEIFREPELLEIFFPLLRNDFKLAQEETGNEKQVSSFLNCNITVMAGKEEELSQAQIDGWKSYTHRHTEVLFFPGGHFFINEHFKDVATVVNRVLAGQGAPGGNENIAYYDGNKRLKI